MGNQNSAEDTRAYREGYPGKADDLSAKQNLEFYQNKRESTPNGALIDVIHKPVELGGWFGDFELLERHHGYIQWLFPIRENGMNMRAQELQLHEAEAIRNDAKCRARVVKSYQLMLHFYGMELVNKETGEIGRAAHYAPRYRHLDSSFHNYLRITRILKCLGELGFEHYKWPFLRFVLTEIYENQCLLNTKRSCLNFWSQVLRNVDEQEAMRRLVKQYEPADSDDEDDEDDDDNEDVVAAVASVKTANTRGRVSDAVVDDDNDDDDDDDNDDDDDEENDETVEIKDSIGDNAASTSNKKKRVKVRRRVTKSTSSSSSAAVATNAGAATN